MKNCKTCSPKPVNPKTEVRDKRDAVRGKARNRRGVLRGAAAAASCLMAATLLGCATATPSSKSQTSKACGNTITVNLNLSLATNALACAAMPGVTITLSDLIGTQVQSADAGRDESVSQTATPSNTPGIVGDKPIETIGEVGKTALTSGASTVLKQAANAAGLTGTAVATDKAVAPVTGSACADGSCAVPCTK